MDSITIVEYSPEYAAAVAEMWNRSSAGWNGQVFDYTEAKVLEKEAKSVHLNLWLALKGADVVGYAKLSPYFAEKGVANIDLLNVDPLLHGSGIGKALVQKCVLRSAELGYDRVDLFTWAGNTKAVPLYKKCGFFWEKMDAQTTHLMNFLPGLLRNPLLKPYFEYFDWYCDLKRELKIEPDGRMDKGFTLFDYHWAKGEDELKVSFEKSGRGIVAISCKGFEVETILTESKPIFGSDYPVQYRLLLKDNALTDVRLCGIDDENIRHRLGDYPCLKEDETISSTFYPEPPSDKASEWMTASGVAARLNIGGESLPLKTGLKVQYPLSCMLQNEFSLLDPGVEYKLFLTVTNNYPFACKYIIRFPEDPVISMTQSEYELNLEANANDNVQISFVASSGCVFEPELLVTAYPNGDQPVSFTRRVLMRLYSLDGMDQKRTTEHDIMINGIYTLSFQRVVNYNYGYFASLYGGYYSFRPPYLGKPYSEEFNHEEPYDVVFEELSGANRITAYYRSKELVGAEVATVFTLFRTGHAESFVRIIALPDDDKEVYYKQSFNLRSEQITFEHEDQLVRFDQDMPEPDFYSLPSGYITGNWIYAEDDNTTYTIVWALGQRVRIDGYALALEHDLRDLLRQGIRETEPVKYYFDTFKNAYQARNYAERSRENACPLHDTLELRVNDGNPFVTQPFAVRLIQRREANLRGKFTLSSRAIPPIVREHEIGDKVQETVWEIADRELRPLDIVSCEAKLPNYTLKRQQLALCSQGEVRTTTEGRIITCENGLMSFSAALDASIPGLISLKYDGMEWLDLGYPEHPPKSTFNPFPGGIVLYPQESRPQTLRDEEHVVAPASLSDQWGAIWEGISITTTFRYFEPLKGLVYRQYYLTRAGVPLLAVVPELLDAGGKARYYGFALESYFQPNGDARKPYIDLPDVGGDWISLSVDAESAYIDRELRHYALGYSDRKTKLNIAKTNKHNVYFHMDPYVIRTRQAFWSDLSHELPQKMPITYFVFGEENIPYQAFISLLETELKSK